MIGRGIRGCQGVGGRVFVDRRERSGHGELVGKLSRLNQLGGIWIDRV